MRLQATALVTVALLLLGVDVPGVGPWRGVDAADGIPPVSQTYTLKTGDAGASPFDSLGAGEYVCDPEALTLNNTCTAVGLDSSVVARPHPINETRALAPDKWRRVVDRDGTPKRLPTPWSNGDRLARSPTEVTASERVYVLAFEMFAVMRNWMFFNATNVTDELWAHFHGPLRDCGLESVAAFQAGKTHPLGRRLDRHDILRMLRDPWWHGGDIASQLSHYADAVQADFLCVAAPELERAPEHAAWPHRDRCVAIRAALGLSPGVAPSCWFTAYRHFYSDGGLDWPFNYDWTYAQPGDSKPKYWTIQMKNAGLGYSGAMWPETEQRGLSMFGRPAYPGTAGGDDVPNKQQRPRPATAAATAATGTSLVTGDHTHDSTRAGGGVGGLNRPPGGALGSELSPEELTAALRREVKYANPALTPSGRPPVAMYNMNFEGEAAAAGSKIADGDESGEGGGGDGGGVAAPGNVVTARLASAFPTWPSRLRYGVWRQARGTSEEQAARLAWACEDVRMAAEALRLGGSCAPTAAGTIAGTAEGSAAAVLRMTEWLRSSFHWFDVGHGPKLLAPGDVPSNAFTSPTLTYNNNDDDAR